ncbi:hypothetical protein [Nocardia sp. AG03]|uniref:hypothetical protein n=1 Tax=Nocardia sp. AG03 TaxID=3025312 RepID=UPI0024188DD7|nr:hypothetical protein [Nocardia sp. AG03]
MTTTLEPVSIPVTDFADRTTRALLACDGSTTVLLEAVLRVPVTIDVREQFRQRADELPRELCGALGVSGDDPVLSRYSTLLTPDGGLVSWNHAVVVEAADNPLYRLSLDRVRPLGSAMAAAGVTHRRRLLRTGHHVRPDTGSGRAAGKSYLIYTDDRPRLHLTEIYHPALFSADLA